MLRVSLKAAVRDDLLAKNPSARVAMPKAERTEARYLTASEVASLLRAAEDTRYHAALSLIAHTGLRSGEARALRWRDVDFGEKTLKVRGTLSRVDGRLEVTEPKTAKSRRTLPLTSAVVEILKTQRRTQRRERLRAANLWTDTGLVFTTETGQPVDSANLRRALNTAADSAGLDDVCVHTLRHSAATAWLESGVNLKAVSELLGHADIRVTADCYGHVTEATSRAAMDTLSKALGI
ncbi:MAG: site-specific integrase [Coriobacteriia bacterium]|nr:site-specific integrase [Coriobacteriia bacterium]